MVCGKKWIERGGMASYFFIHISQGQFYDKKEKASPGWITQLLRALS